MIAMYIFDKMLMSSCTIKLCGVDIHLSWHVGVGDVISNFASVKCNKGMTSRVTSS
jgi:hypothetical protein